jgi:hypothetical protein
MFTINEVIECEYKSLAVGQEVSSLSDQYLVGSSLQGLSKSKCLKACNLNDICNLVVYKITGEECKLYEQNAMSNLINDLNSAVYQKIKACYVKKSPEPSTVVK